MKFTILENDNNYIVVAINNHTLLFSYRSLVASRSGRTLTVYPKYDYSITTSKHLKKFTGYTSKEIEKGKNLPFNVIFAEDDQNIKLDME